MQAVGGTASAVATALGDCDNGGAWLTPRPGRGAGRARDDRPRFVAAGAFLAFCVAFAWPGTATAPVGPARAAVAEGSANAPAQKSSLTVDALLDAFARRTRAADPRSADALFLDLPDLPQPVALVPLVKKEKSAEEILRFGSRGVQRWKVDSILRAATVTDTDPVYLMALADKESSFSPLVRAGTSSAEGMFQFIDKTWLKMIREFGKRYGLAAEAAMIFVVDENPYVMDEGLRNQILGLRRDAWLSAVMAAELLKKDRLQIAQRIGRNLRPVEFYLSHFLGPDDAGRFLDLLDHKPTENAAAAFPAPAKANESIFFVKETYTEVVTRKVGKGKKKKIIKETHQRTRMRGLSIADVYAKFQAMIDRRLDHYEPVASYATPSS